MPDDHYDHAAFHQDRQVLLPLRHLEDLVAEGMIGNLAASVVSSMGYQPDVARVVDETIPAVVHIAQAEQVQAAQLVAARSICCQSVGLIARALGAMGSPRRLQVGVQV